MVTDRILKEGIKEIKLQITDLIAMTEDIYGLLIDNLPLLEADLILMMLSMDKSDEDLFLSLDPIKDLMVKVQIQDIVRQALENIDHCLSTILTDQTASYEKSHELLVNQKIIELAENLLVNVWDKLIQSLQEIEIIISDLLVNMEVIIKVRSEQEADLTRVIARELQDKMKVEIANLQMSYQKLITIAKELKKSKILQDEFEKIESKLQDLNNSIRKKLDEEIEAGAYSQTQIAQGLELVSQDLQGLVVYLRTHSELVIAKLLLEDEELDVGSGGELVLF